MYCSGHCHNHTPSCSISHVVSYTGHRHVPAIELQPCPQLQADLPAGCKVNGFAGVYNCLLPSITVNTTTNTHTGSHQGCASASRCIIVDTHTCDSVGWSGTGIARSQAAHAHTISTTHPYVCLFGGGCKDNTEHLKLAQFMASAFIYMYYICTTRTDKRRSAAERDVYAAARAAAWGPSPPGQQHHAGAPPQQPPMSMPTTETTREDQSVTTRLPLTAIPTNTMMTHQSMATQGPPQGPSQQQQHCAPAPQQNPAPLHDVIQSTQPPLQDVAACSTVPVSYVPATAEPTPAHHHTPCPTHDEGVDVVQDASNAETHAPSAVQQAGSPSTAGCVLSTRTVNTSRGV